MNILLSSVINSKFFNDISQVTIPDHKIAIYDIRNNLYKIYSLLRPKSIFINILEISDEIKQFAEEYGHECNIFCFCPKANYSNYNFEEIPNINYISYRGYIDNEKCSIIPSNIINKNYLDSIKNENKIDQSICFLDSIDNKNYNTLLSKLYPNKSEFTFSIKIFNDPQFKHPQNLGFINHVDKLELIAKSKYIIVEDDFEYYYEALYLNCQMINIEEIKNNINLDKISNREVNNLISDVKDYANYISDMVKV